MRHIAILAVASACGGSAKPAPATTIPALELDRVFVEVEPAPVCPAPAPVVIDDETRRKIMNEANDRWNETRDEYFRDYSAITADLPPLGAAWQRRTSVGYRGVVNAYLVAERDQGNEGPLMLVLVEPLVDGDGGRVQRFELLPRSESPPKGTFEPLWSDPKTGRSLGPIHAAVALRPSRSAKHRERQNVVVYNPRGRPDILLVATKSYLTLEWTPLLRIDLPAATRFSVYPVPESH